jgi:carboxylesterase type B
MLAGTDPRVIADLTATMQRAWIGFVRDGDPGWPAWRRAAPTVLSLDVPAANFAWPM